MAISAALMATKNSNTIKAPVGSTGQLVGVQANKHPQQIISNNINKPKQYSASDKLNAHKDHNDGEADVAALSTIAILRRHPMYDCLVLVKKFNSFLNSYTLEFPTKTMQPQVISSDKLVGDAATKNDENLADNSSDDSQENQDQQQHCCKTKLRSVYLDEDDPVHNIKLEQAAGGLLAKNCDQEELVYVPMNGLLTRLDNFERHNIPVDSRVYAFAIGIKTAERFLTSSSMREVNETPDVGY